MTQSERVNYGTLILKVKTGLGAFPVPDATVTVTSEKREDSDIKFVGTTDAAGISEAIFLPSGIERDEEPNAAGNLVPDTYTIEVTKEGYYTLFRYGVPVFPGVTAIQTLYLTPRPKRVGGVDNSNQDTQFSEGIREETLNES